MNNIVKTVLKMWLLAGIFTLFVGCDSSSSTQCVDSDSVAPNCRMAGVSSPGAEDSVKEEDEKESDDSKPKLTAPTAGSAIQFSLMSATGTTVNWGAASDEATAQADLMYKVVSATNASQIDTIEEALAKLDSVIIRKDWTKNLTSIKVEDLVTGTEYTFAVIVKNDAGKMAIYIPKSVTPADSDAPSPGTINFSNVMYTTMTVSWTPASDDVSDQSALKYKLVCVETGQADISTLAGINAQSAPELKVDWSAGVTTFDLSDLRRGPINSPVSFTCNVAVEDEAGKQSAYTEVSQQTREVPR
ncbi:MAG: fibronectin type III domain-containing protein [Oligoflexales bacterium]